MLINQYQSEAINSNLVAYIRTIIKSKRKTEQLILCLICWKITDTIQADSN